MEGLQRGSNGHGVLQPLEVMAGITVGIHELTLQSFSTEAFTVEVAAMTAAAKGGRIVPGCQNRGQVKSGNARQGHHQQLTEQESLPLQMVGITPRIGHGSPPADVQFIGLIAPITEAAVTDKAAPEFALLQQLCQPLLVHQSFQGAQADAVMAGAEIQQVGGVGQGRPALQPAIEQISFLPQHRIQE